MIRSLHRWPGLIAALFLCVIALSGTALAVYPAIESVRSPSSADISVAELASRVQAMEPTVEQIRRAPSGRITAYYYEGDQPAAAVIDPATGEAIGNADTSALQRWLTNLHRSLFLSDAGRIMTATAAAAMLALCLSGLVLLARRSGGWRYLFSPARGTGHGKLHSSIARLSVFGLGLSSITALWMTAATFGFIPEGAGAPPFPSDVSGQTGANPAAITALEQTSVDKLRSLTFPVNGDKTDVFTLKTSDGEGYIDQGTGRMLAWADAGAWEHVTDFIVMLHTGQGAALLGLLLGLSALGIPFLSWTGLRLWLTGRKRGRARHSVAVGDADTIVLVGSEGGSTWGFADTLCGVLSESGLRVHVGPMSAFTPQRWPQAQRILLLAATYGDGEAPASAGNFLEKLAALPEAPKAPFAVLGFGDRSFPSFCGYAAKIARAGEAKGCRLLLPMEPVDRQSPQDFARWGRDLAAVLGLEFELNHQPTPPKSRALTLVSRRDYGTDVQAPTAILRFALPTGSLWRRLTRRTFPGFEAGDILGILPEGSDLPRFYSLASGKRDGFVEICVRRHPGGLCSGQLTTLEPGQTIQAFLRHNPTFRPARGKAPVLLIGAGTGIGPLAGFARANRTKRPMHLYFGTRHPQSDALYAEELAAWQQNGRLASVTTAFSRGERPIYVQDTLRSDAAHVARLVSSGAQILVCGGREMAAGVSAALADILATQGLTLATLKAEGRYAEDVY
ncbi:MAG: N-acetylglucosamine transferase [Ahrensia sp.]|nr:N-acetylglucosamine transferase [Ahrensia sp.]